MCDTGCGERFTWVWAPACAGVTEGKERGDEGAGLAGGVAGEDGTGAESVEGCGVDGVDAGPQ